MRPIDITSPVAFICVPSLFGRVAELVEREAGDFGHDVIGVGSGSEAGGRGQHDLVGKSTATLAVTRAIG